VFSKIIYRSAVALAILGFCVGARADETLTEALEPQSENASQPGAHAGGHAGGHAEHIGEKGVSNDPAEFKSDLAIFTFLVFLLLLALLSKFAWGPVIEGLERREATIHDNIAGAEAARIKAEKMLAEHPPNSTKSRMKFVKSWPKRGATPSIQKTRLSPLLKKKPKHPAFGLCKTLNGRATRLSMICFITWPAAFAERPNRSSAAP